MKKIESFFTNVKALQAFHLLRQGAVILVAILLAQSGVGKVVIGNFEQLLYIGYAVSFFWVAGLIQGLLSSYQQYIEQDRKHFLFNAYLLFTGLSSFLFILLWLGKDQALSFFTGKTELEYFSLFLVYLLLNMPTYLVENFYLLRDQGKWIFLFGLFSFLGHILVICLPVFLQWDFYYAIAGLVSLAGIKHLWLLGLLWKQTAFHFRWDLIQRWVRLSAPLILYALLGGLMQTFDNWLINYWYEGAPEPFAVYRYGARELPLTLALASAFSSAMLPEIGKDVPEALKSIRIKSRKLFHWLFGASILLLMSSQYWFTWVFSEAFADSIVIFDTFILIIVSRLIFSRTILVGLQDNYPVLIISMIEFAINVVLSLVLIKYLGLLGVALATLSAFSIEKVLLCWRVYQKFRIAPAAYTDLGWWGAYSIILIGIYLVK
jgi:O-antigen/teichoic acid export membrane protein